MTTRIPRIQDNSQYHASRFPAWRSHPMTETQADRISRELGRRQLPDYLRVSLQQAVAAGQTRDGQPATKGSASDLIDWLASKPYTSGTRPATTSDRDQNEPVREAGFYRTEDGRVFQVVESKQNRGRFYAKAVTAHGWDYDAGKGMVYRLRPEHKMTTDDILQFGIRSEVCAICSTPLEDPVSKFIGIGPSCGPKTIGKDAYKAAAKSAKSDPQVAEQLAAIKAVKAAEKQAKVQQALTEATPGPITRQDALRRIVEAEAARYVREGTEPDLDDADPMAGAVSDVYWSIMAARHEEVQERAAEQAKWEWKQSVERF